MTKASEDLIKKAYQLDGLKKHLGSLNEQAYNFAFPNKEFSAFPLFYLADKYLGDIYDVENEAIGIIFKTSTENGDKIKTLVSTMSNGHVWTNVFAFNAFTEAVNNLEIKADTVVPYSPTEIAFSLVNLAGIEGAITLPIKNEVIGYIAASLKEDGWDIPPLFLMFKNIEVMFENEEYLEAVKSLLGHLSIQDIIHLESFDKLGIDNRPDVKNYLIRNQELCIELESKYSKLMFDWTTAIRGE